MDGSRLRVKVVIISRDLEPARQLRRSFRRAGAHVLISAYLEDAIEDAAEADVALLLADGYPLEKVLEVVPRLPFRLTLVLTAHVSDFRSCATADTHARVQVVSQPVWSRTLVEVIRRGLPLSVGDA